MALLQIFCHLQCHVYENLAYPEILPDVNLTGGGGGGGGGSSISSVVGLSKLFLPYIPRLLFLFEIFHGSNNK